jgi:hypothetical protein
LDISDARVPVFRLVCRCTDETFKPIGPGDLIEEIAARSVGHVVELTVPVIEGSG